MSFENLLEEISPKLKAITKKLNGRFTFFDEDDLYQEALLHLWQEYKTGELSNKTDSFILQGCYFFLKNYIRKGCKGVERNSVSLNANINGEGNILEDVLSSEGTESQADSINVSLLIEDVRRILTEREKDVFSLYLEGLTTREIGKRLGISHVMVVKIEKRIKEKCKALG